MYELPDKYIKNDLDLTQPEWNAIKEKLQKSGKFCFLDGWVKIVNHDKYNSYKNGKSGIAYEKELTVLPAKLIEYRRGMDTSMDTSMDTRSIPTINHKSEIINKKSETNKKEFIDSLRISPEFKDMNIDKELIKFKDYLAASGKKYKDYKAAFRNWLRNSGNFIPYKKKELPKGDNARMLEHLNQNAT
jgi:hypothetical protein